MSETARMDRKNKGGRPKKRKFYGNQYFTIKHKKPNKEKNY